MSNNRYSISSPECPRCGAPVEVPHRVGADSMVSFFCLSCGCQLFFNEDKEIQLKKMQNEHEENLKAIDANCKNDSLEWVMTFLFFIIALVFFAGCVYVAFFR